MAATDNGGQNPGGGEQQQPGAGGGQQQQQQPNPAGGGQQQAVQQPGGGAGAGGEKKTFSYTEDRSDWIPRHRLNEQGGKLTAAEKRAQDAETALEAERNRVRALAGLEPKDPKAAETQEVRDALYTMFPQLKALENLTAEQLQDVFDAANAARTTSQASWERHATTMLNDLDSEAADTLGVDKLTPTQQKSLRRAYREEAAQAVQERKAQAERGERKTLETLPTDNDFVARHERGDKTLLKEFVKAYLDDWYEPARRSVTANQARRQMRPVPRGERTRQPITQGAQKIDFNNDAEFKKALLAARGGDGQP